MNQELERKIEDLRREIEELRRSPTMPDHFHNGNDSSRVSLQDINYKAYGQMYINSNTTITVAATDTWYEVTSNLLAGVISGAKFNSHFIEIAQTGAYMININVALNTASASQEVAATVMVNGTASETGHAHSTIVAANKSSTTSSVTILNLTAGDEISLAVENHTAATNIVVEHAQISILKL